MIIRVLSKYDITGTRDDINSGVFVGKEKICAIGLSASRWITTHGFALNVNCELKYFDTSVITPCGLEDRGVTSMSTILGDDLSIDEVSNLIVKYFKDVFDVQVEQEE